MLPTSIIKYNEIYAIYQIVHVHVVQTVLVNISQHIFKKRTIKNSIKLHRPELYIP